MTSGRLTGAFPAEVAQFLQQQSALLAGEGIDLFPAQRGQGTAVLLGERDGGNGRIAVLIENNGDEDRPRLGPGVEQQRRGRTGEGEVTPPRMRIFQRNFRLYAGGARAAAFRAVPSRHARVRRGVAGWPGRCRV